MWREKTLNTSTQLIHIILWEATFGDVIIENCFGHPSCPIATKSKQIEIQNKVLRYYSQNQNINKFNI